MIEIGKVKRVYIDSNRLDVRVPIFENANSTSEVILSCRISYQPGNLQGYSIDDTVFVTTENNDWSLPIVIGKLYNGDETNPSSALKINALEVSGKTTLGTDTKIGSITYDNLKDAIDKIALLSEDTSDIKTAMDNISKKVTNAGTTSTNMDTLASGYLTKYEYNKDMTTLNSRLQGYEDRIKELEDFVDSLNYGFFTFSNYFIYVNAGELKVRLSVKDEKATVNPACDKVVYYIYPHRFFKSVTEIEDNEMYTKKFTDPELPVDKQQEVDRIISNNGLAIQQLPNILNFTEPTKTTAIFPKDMDSSVETYIRRQMNLVEDAGARNWRILPNKLTISAAPLVPDGEMGKTSTKSLTYYDLSKKSIEGSPDGYFSKSLPHNAIEKNNLQLYNGSEIFSDVKDLHWVLNRNPLNTDDSNSNTTIKASIVDSSLPIDKVWDSGQNFGLHLEQNMVGLRDQVLAETTQKTAWLNYLIKLPVMWVDNLAEQKFVYAAYGDSSGEMLWREIPTAGGQFYTYEVDPEPNFTWSSTTLYLYGKTKVSSIPQVEKIDINLADLIYNYAYSSSDKSAAQVQLRAYFNQINRLTPYKLLAGFYPAEHYYAGDPEVSEESYHLREDKLYYRSTIRDLKQNSIYNGWVRLQTFKINANSINPAQIEYYYTDDFGYQKSAIVLQNIEIDTLDLEESQRYEKLSNSKPIEFVVNKAESNYSEILTEAKLPERRKIGDGPLDTTQYYPIQVTDAKLTITTTASIRSGFNIKTSKDNFVNFNISIKASNFNSFAKSEEADHAKITVYLIKGRKTTEFINKNKEDGSYDRVEVNYFEPKFASFGEYQSPDPHLQNGQSVEWIDNKGRRLDYNFKDVAEVSGSDVTININGTWFDWWKSSNNSLYSDASEIADTLWYKIVVWDDLKDSSKTTIAEKSKYTPAYSGTWALVEQDGLFGKLTEENLTSHIEPPLNEKVEIPEDEKLVDLTFIYAKAEK